MSPVHAQPARVRAFTLVELLVVIGIIALLISILLPTLNKARESASAAMCSSNLRQVHTFFMDYARDQRDHFPAPWVGLGNPGNNTWAYQWPYLIWTYARQAPMPRGMGQTEGPLGAINDPNQPGPNGGGWDRFGGIFKPTVTTARFFFCTTSVANGMGFTGGTYNPEPDSWFTTYTMTQSARGRNPFAAGSPPDYNLWGYAKYSKTRNASDKLLLSDPAGNYGDRLKSFPDALTVFSILTNNASGNPEHGKWYNPHNKLSNMLFYDGHVERRDPKSLTRYNFRYDE
jgi:prepilin-type processing-associated H-X9-DG protein/prepilin-type N-terminal cleavage/methylation domain-containing protein